MNPELFHIRIPAIPWLFDFPGFAWPIYTYGVMTALGITAAYFTIQHLASRQQLDNNRIADLIFWGLVIGFIGARSLFIITRFEFYLEHPLDIFKVWEGGLVFFGGPLLGVPFVVWYLKRYRIPMWKAGDAIMPGLAIGHAFGRVGCLASGCCHGSPTGTGFGVKLTSTLVDQEFRAIPLHPTQLYEAFSMFILFLVLLAIFRRKKFDGQVVFSYFIAYPIIRSIIEIFRGDQIRGFVIDNVLSTSQFISLVVFMIALVALIIRLRAVKAES